MTGLIKQKFLKIKKYKFSRIQIKKRQIVFAVILFGLTSSSFTKNAIAAGIYNASSSSQVIIKEKIRTYSKYMLISVGAFAVVISVDLISANVSNVKIKWRLKEANSLLTTCVLKNAELGVTHQAELAACNKDLTTVAKVVSRLDGFELPRYVFTM